MRVSPKSTEKVNFLQLKIESLCHNSDDFEYQFIEEEDDETGKMDKMLNITNNSTTKRKRRQGSLMLARIGTKLLESGNILDEELGIDENDLVMDLMNANDKLSKALFLNRNFEDLRVQKEASKRVKTQASETNTLAQESTGSKEIKLVALLSTVQRPKGSLGSQENEFMSFTSLLDWSKGIEERLNLNKSGKKEESS